eukprot:Skav235794  [mRNA]  locus=scaffold1267:66896:81295:+ [translate_table: standard]
MVGDQCQLPATVLSQEAQTKGLDISMFDRHLAMVSQGWLGGDAWSMVGGTFGMDFEQLEAAEQQEASEGEWLGQQQPQQPDEDEQQDWEQRSQSQWNGTWHETPQGHFWGRTLDEAVEYAMMRSWITVDAAFLDWWSAARQSGSVEDDRRSAGSNGQQHVSASRAITSERLHNNASDSHDVPPPQPPAHSARAVHFACDLALESHGNQAASSQDQEGVRGSVGADGDRRSFSVGSPDVPCPQASEEPPKKKVMAKASGKELRNGYKTKEIDASEDMDGLGLTRAVNKTPRQLKEEDAVSRTFGMDFEQLEAAEQQEASEGEWLGEQAGFYRGELKNAVTDADRPMPAGLPFRSSLVFLHVDAIESSGGASKKNEGEADCAAWIVELWRSSEDKEDDGQKAAEAMKTEAVQFNVLSGTWTKLGRQAAKSKDAVVASAVKPAPASEWLKPTRFQRNNLVKQSGVPHVKWAKNLVAWKVEFPTLDSKGKMIGRMGRAFAVKKFLVPGRSEAEADAEALGAAKAFRAELVQQGVLSKPKPRDPDFTSEVPGVRWAKRDQKWQVEIPKKGSKKKIYGGLFTEKAAAEAKALELREQHGLQRQVMAVRTLADLAELPVFSPKVSYPGVTWDQKWQKWRAQCQIGGAYRAFCVRPKDHSEEQLESSFQEAVAWRKKQEKERAKPKKSKVGLVKKRRKQK